VRESERERLFPFFRFLLCCRCLADLLCLPLSLSLSLFLSLSLSLSLPLSLSLFFSQKFSVIVDGYQPNSPFYPSPPSLSSSFTSLYDCVFRVCNRAEKQNRAAEFYCLFFSLMEKWLRESALVSLSLWQENSSPFLEVWPHVFTRFSVLKKVRE